MSSLLWLQVNSLTTIIRRLWRKEVSLNVFNSVLQHHAESTNSFCYRYEDSCRPWISHLNQWLNQWAHSSRVKRFMAVQILRTTRESSSGLDQCKLVTAHECLGKCSWTGERLMQRNTPHSNACMHPQLEVWERLGNSSTENSRILLKEGKNEETGCPGPENKRKCRLHSFSSDGKQAATMIL